MKLSTSLISTSFLALSASAAIVPLDGRPRPPTLALPKLPQAPSKDHHPAQGHKDVDVHLGAKADKDDEAKKPKNQPKPKAPAKKTGGNKKKPGKKMPKGGKSDKPSSPTGSKNDTPGVKAHVHANAGGFKRRDLNDGDATSADLRVRTNHRKHHKHPLPVPVPSPRVRLGISLPPDGMIISTRSTAKQDYSNPRGWRTRRDYTTAGAGTPGFVEVATPLAHSSLAKSVAGLVYSVNPARNGSGYDLGTSDTQSTQFYLYPTETAQGAKVYELRVPIVDSSTFMTVDHCATFPIGPAGALSLEACGTLPGRSQMFSYDAKSGQVQPVYEIEDPEAPAAASNTTATPLFAVVPDPSQLDATPDPNASQFTPDAVSTVTGAIPAASPTIQADAVPTPALPSTTVDSAGLPTPSADLSPNVLYGANFTSPWSLLTNSSQVLLANSSTLLQNATAPALFDNTTAAPMMLKTEDVNATTVSVDHSSAPVVLFFIPAESFAAADDPSVPTDSVSVPAPSATPTVTNALDETTSTSSVDLPSTSTDLPAGAPTALAMKAVVDPISALSVTASSLPSATPDLLAASAALASATGSALPCSATGAAGSTVPQPMSELKDALGSSTPC